MRIILSAYRHKKQSTALILTLIVISSLIFVSVAVKSSKEQELKNIYNATDVNAFIIPIPSDNSLSRTDNAIPPSKAHVPLRYMDFIKSYNLTKKMMVWCTPVENNDNIMKTPSYPLYGITGFDMLDGYFEGAVEFFDGYGFDDFLTNELLTHKKIVLLRKELAEFIGLKLGDTVSIMQATDTTPLATDIIKYRYDAVVAGLHTLGMEDDYSYDIIAPADFSIAINYSGGKGSYDEAWYALKELHRLNEFKDIMLEKKLLYGFSLIILDENLVQIQNVINSTLGYLNMAIAAEYYLTIIMAFVISFIILKTRIQEIALSIAIGEGIKSIFVKFMIESMFVCLVGVVAGNIIGTIISTTVLSTGITNYIGIAISNLFFILSFTAGSAGSLFSTFNIKPMEILTRKE